jgi:pyruvate kinase
MYGANHFPGVAGIASHTETGSTAMLMSRLSSGLPIFALSRNPETLQRLALCRGVIPLYFDVSAFDSRDVEARTMEFLNDAGFVSKGDFILMTNGTRVGQAGGTDSIKLLSVG